MMKMKPVYAGILTSALALAPYAGRTENPIITGIYTADPSARVFNGRMYLYPSHDRDDSQTWDMTDWHVFSSKDMVSWTDHGVALGIKDIPFAKKYAWAPDCAFRNGKYYFYFPVSMENGKNTDRVGVAVGDSPEGPFKCRPNPLVSGYPRAFDPCVFTDEDGTAYLVTGQRHIFIAKLKENMTELAEPQKPIAGAKGFFEAVWMHKYNGKYYLSYSSGPSICYALADNPYGPFEFKGDILISKGMPQPANTTHHSIVQYQGKWYMFYHNRKLAEDRKAPKPDYKRSVCVNELFYKPDGTIVPVKATVEGIKPVK